MADSWTRRNSDAWAHEVGDRLGDYSASLGEKPVYPVVDQAALERRLKGHMWFRACVVDFRTTLSQMGGPSRLASVRSRC